jgi:hypothetical protein
MKSWAPDCDNEIFQGEVEAIAHSKLPVQISFAALPMKFTM